MYWLLNVNVNVICWRWVPIWKWPLSTCPDTGQVTVKVHMTGRQVAMPKGRVPVKLHSFRGVSGREFTGGVVLQFQDTMYSGAAFLLTALSFVNS